MSASLPDGQQSTMSFSRPREKNVNREKKVARVVVEGRAKRVELGFPAGGNPSDPAPPDHPGSPASALVPPNRPGSAPDAGSIGRPSSRATMDRVSNR